MSTNVMMERITEASPRLKARMAGGWWLLYVSMAVVAGFARRGLVVNGDAVATTTNILAHEPLFRLGFAADLLAIACYIAVTVLLYDLFKPVNRTVSLLAAFFSMVGCTIQGLGCVFELAPLVVLGGTQHSSVFKVEQLQALAYIFLKLYSQADSIALVFFGFFSLLIGYLIFKSTFLPRILGVLMAVAGTGGLIFLSPSFGAKYLPYIVAADIGEILLILWLLVFAVNAERWKAQASAAGIGVSRRAMNS
ncbi:MAG: DUF4386 domain-containing protein [Acidobacteriia bacterium]|nr:DUF4386 domain-containing protein [Terriglobia bacterium]